MNCAEIGDLLDLLMDDALTDEQRREMEAHGRECPACAEAIRATMQMKALFAGMDTEADVPLQIQAKWRGAVKAEAARQKKRRLTRWIASAAAAVVAVAGIGLALNGRNAPAKNATLMAVEESVTVAEDEAPETAEEASTTAKAAVASNGLGDSAGEAMEYAAESAGEAAEYAVADSAVVEADGAAEAEIVPIDDEDVGMVEIEEAEEPLSCAAAAQRSPACELALRVIDVETACDRIRDLVQEYEGAADVQTQEDGGANIYIEIDGQNAGDFLNAVLPMDISDETPQLPELPGEGSLLLLLTING